MSVILLYGFLQQYIQCNNERGELVCVYVC